MPFTILKKGNQGSLKDGCYIRVAPGSPSPGPRCSLTMRPVSRCTLDWIYSVLLLMIILLSWGFVIYASTVAAGQQLQNEFPDKFFAMNELR